MENSKGSGPKKSEKFFDGKGFYIVLFLCAAVIGVSAWTLLSGKGTVNEAEGDINLSKPYELRTPDAMAGDNEDTDETLWEIPEGVEETLAEAPEIASEVMSRPATPSATPKPKLAEPTAKAFIWPVVGEIEKPYAVTSLIYDKTMGDWRTHSGIDIAAALGDKVMAACSGSVVALYVDDLYGTTVVLDHGDNLRSVYAGLAEVPTVKVGDAILCGETLGSVGTTALCETGDPTHLHFAMKANGQSVDPCEYLPKL
ncbi:MAG: M23 family metallopeptidase [Oscillospiraceae bacterium]